MSRVDDDGNEWFDLTDREDLDRLAEAMDRLEPPPASDADETGSH